MERLILKNTRNRLRETMRHFSSPGVVLALILGAASGPVLAHGTLNALPPAAVTEMT